MNLRQVETFAAVMGCGTASGAAEVLRVTQPAVSRSIAELERAVGFALFARMRKRLVPTPEARILYDEVKAVFLGMDAIRAAAARIRDRGTGQIRVASLAAACHSVVPKAIARFRSKHPEIRVTLVVVHSRNVRDMVASGQCDVGLAADLVDTKGVIFESFMAREALCVLPAAHPLSSKEVIAAADLDGVDLIGFMPEDRFRQRIDAALLAAGVSPRVVVETASAPSAISLVAAGVGVTLASPYSIRGMDQSKIVTKNFRPSIEVRTVLMRPPDRPKSQLVREFITALMAAR